jgi:glycine/D-amino acid oxidase-like deaminating enzyme
MKPGRPFPSALWDATATAPVEAPALHGAVRADVAIVGGGITGCSAALALAERGAAVVLLEAREIGWGTSGRAGGQVIPGYHLDPDALASAFGRERGERMIEFGAAAPDLLFGLVAKHAIACEPRRSGWIQATQGGRGLRSLRRRMEQWHRRGAPVEWLDRERLAALLGTAEYAGGWLDRRGGSIQPLSYVRGLAHAAMRAGASLHARSEVVRLARECGRWRAETRAGSVSAACVIVGTNAYTGRLWPRLRGAVLRAHSVQLATAPLAEAVRRSVLPQGHVCADTRLLLRYFRLDSGGRLVMGGAGGLLPPAGPGEPSYRLLERTIRRMFPQIAAPRFEFHWYGKGAVTFDMLPHLHEPTPGLIAALGYAGRGLAMATALGALVARRALGEPIEALPFPCWPLRSRPGAALAALALAARGLVSRRIGR